MMTLDSIWSDDVLQRRSDAELLTQYIETIGGYNTKRNDSHTYTIAVEAPYGYGKTFFLKRLEKHLSPNHPVAYVDAWADDLADEPLTAIVATLRAALKPLISESRRVPELWGRVVASAGTVSAIAAKGFLTRLAASLVTTTATEAILEAFASTGTSSESFDTEKVAQAAGDSSKDGIDWIFTKDSSSAMNRKIMEFDEGRKAVHDLKRSLAEIVEAVKESQINLPIVVIIDELDRCRPTYAVKLLEEVKHIFDVSGIIFVLGLNGAQLSASLSASYGPKFDGASYLRRFISRTFHLGEAELYPMFEILLQPLGDLKDRIDIFPNMPRQQDEKSSFASVISGYAAMYNLSPRDTFQYVDILRTSLALSSPNRLVGEYIFPLIASNVRGELPGVLGTPIKSTNMPVFLFHDKKGIRQERDAWSLANEMEKHARTPFRDLLRHVNEFSGDIIAVRIFEARTGWEQTGKVRFGPDQYGKLLSSVARFT